MRVHKTYVTQVLRIAIVTAVNIT